MDDDVKEKWIQALRSDNYSQGYRQLRKHPHKDTFTTRHCCLGVLCDLYNEEHDNSHWMSRSTFVVEKEGEEYMESLSLPPPVKTWAGIESTKVRIKDGEYDISVLNDGGGGIGPVSYSFDEIANIIEKQL